MNTPKQSPTPTLYGDAAKTSIKDDKFGLEQAASSVATLLMSRVAANGYTIGIQGKWGSGKTTFANFIVEKIEGGRSLTHKILRFDPWLVRKRDALIREFFNGLLSKIDEFRSDPVVRASIENEKPGLLDQIVAKLEKYRDLLDAGAKVVATVAPFDPTLHGQAASGALKALGFVANAITKLFRPNPLTLEGLRNAIKQDLNALANLSPNARFTIIIDDMDRLDPEDSVEILRLIRAVADFPIVTYVVCFDREYLAEQITRVIGVGDGHDYIEKIFQNILSIPPQEPFALRRLARELLTERFPDEFSYSDTSDRDDERGAIFFDRWLGKFVLTPRDAIRFSEAVTFGWPHLKGHGDFLDYAWLQLIRLKCPRLYEWTREYVVNLGSFRDGGRPGDQASSDSAQELVEILRDEKWLDDHDLAGMSYFLPGVENYLDKKKPRVFDVTNKDLAEFEGRRRLGSPSHWRMYFAFDKPSYALDDDILGQFRAVAVRDPQKGQQILRDLISRPHPIVGHYLDTFLERLYDLKTKLTDAEQIGIVSIFGEVLDEAHLNPAAFSISPWSRAEAIISPAVGPYFSEICATGSAINWLSDAIRYQGFARGRPNVERVRSELQWLTDEEFESSLTAVLSRLYAMDIESILKGPQPITMLYCWKQLGDDGALKQAVSSYISSDENFIHFLDRLRGWAASSDKGVYRVLQNQNVENFLGAERSRERLTSLIDDGRLSKETNALAIDIRDKWDIHTH